MIGKLRVAFFVSTLMQPAAHASDFHIVHCLKGCPTGTGETNDLVVREVYALSSNDTTKFDDWVAYRVSKETIGSSNSLKRTWKADPVLESMETLEPDDFSCANDMYKYDRGHQAPLASFAGTVYWRSTNYLSNITPQIEDLNQGPWKKLESAVRHAAYHVDQLYVLTGTLYDGTQMPRLPKSDEDHQVPTGYWKVISNARGRMTAFVFDQASSRKSDYCSFRVAVMDVERRSGLNLFPRATSWPVGNLDSDLGCTKGN